jgi:NitT/TauT family transport system substrate-binding protein
VLATLFAVLAFVSNACTPHDPAPAPILRIGVPPLEQNALLYIAEHEGLFRNRELRVEIRDYPTGPDAIDALLRGEVDIAETAEFPFVRAVLRSHPLKILACNDKFENDYLVVRGIDTIRGPQDLKGLRVGVTLGSITEFYLGRFLALNGMSIDEVAVLDVRPHAFDDAIASGEVDAVLAWQPHVYRMQKDPGNVGVWKAQAGQAVFGILVGRDDWLSTNADVARRFLAALRDAEDFLVSRPDRSREIVRARLNYEADYIASVWPQHQFRLSLDQTLVLAMKDEAVWLLAGREPPGGAVPDFTAYIHEGLRSIKPQGVTIIK